MAAQLTDEGRSPAVQKVSVAEYEYFVATVANPPKPSKALVALLSASKRAK